jgi:hypothetical protein
MAHRSFLDPNLFDRADKAQQGANAFLDRLSAIAGKLGPAVSDRNLQDAAQAEAKRSVESGLGTLSLTVNNLTPGMDRVASELSKQYDNWRAEFDRHKSDLDTAIDGMEREIEHIQHAEIPELNTGKLAALLKADQDLERSTAYTQNREQHSAEKGRFERLRTFNRGNFPRNVNPILYGVILFAIGVGDMVVNYNVFLSKFEILIALFFTVIVGAIVAATSHVHGKYFKQRKLLFTLESDDTDRKGIHRELMWMTGAFLVALAFIFWARYSYFASGAGLDFSSDGLLSMEFIISKVSPTIFFNLGVWFVGAVLAFVLHERVPGLREAYVSWKRLDAELEEMREKVKSKKRDTERTFDNEIAASGARLAQCNGRVTELRATRDKLVDAGKNLRMQFTSQGSTLMKRYVGLLCAHIVAIEGDASGMAFVSPNRGRISMPEFEASDFSIGI